MFNVKEEWEKMQEYLKERTDFEVVRGYKEAKADFEKTEYPMVGGVLEFIKKEMERRGIKEDDVEEDDGTIHSALQRIRSVKKRDAEKKNSGLQDLLQEPKFGPIQNVLRYLDVYDLTTSVCFASKNFRTAVDFHIIERCIEPKFEDLSGKICRIAVPVQFGTLLNPVSCTLEKRNQRII